MIDEKKIEEIAKVYMIGEFYDKDESEWNYPITNEEIRNQCIIDFKEGAKWAINWFLDNLWHPASEEPRKDVSIIVETHNDKNMFYYAWNRWQDNFYPSWTDAVLCSRVSRWLYIDDLFPEKGGNHD